MGTIVSLSDLDYELHARILSGISDIWHKCSGLQVNFLCVNRANVAFPHPTRLHTQKVRLIIKQQNAKRPFSLNPVVQVFGIAMREKTHINI
jgi:hypothetical protein